ncbi:MAG TPA: hypothetical protein PKH80_06850 [Methanofastidiosum sp.]|nr:hypothetical protein [Methanofastidiosum sp.]HNU61854.1 hypothetical protein [Methanofastidiosum sp.]
MRQKIIDNAEFIDKCQLIINELDINSDVQSLNNQKTIISQYEQITNDYREIYEQRKALKNERNRLSSSLKGLKFALHDNPYDPILIMQIDQTIQNIDTCDKFLREIDQEYFNRKSLYEVYETSKIPESSSFLSNVILDRFGFKQLSLFPPGHKAYYLKDKKNKSIELSDDEESYIRSLNKWCDEFTYLLKKYIHDPISKHPSLYDIEYINNHQIKGHGDAWWYSIKFKSGLELQIRTSFPFTVKIKYNLPKYDFTVDAPYNLITHQDPYDSNTYCLSRANEELHKLFEFLFEVVTTKKVPSDNVYLKIPVNEILDLQNITILNDVDPCELTYIKKLQHSKYYDLSDNYPYNFALSLQKLFNVEYQNIIPSYLELHVNFFFPTKRKQDLFNSAIMSYAQLHSEHISILKGSTIYFEFPNRPKSYVYNKTLELYQRDGISIPWHVTRFEIKFESKDISKLSSSRRKDQQTIRYLSPYLSGRPAFSYDHRRKLFNSFLIEIFEKYYPLAGLTEFIRSLSDKSTPYLDEKLSKLKNKSMRDILYLINDYKDIDIIALNQGFSEYQFRKFLKKLSSLRLIKYDRSLRYWILTALGLMCLDYHVPLASFFYSLNSSKNDPPNEADNNGLIVGNTRIHKEPINIFEILQNLVIESLNSYQEVPDG